MFIGDWLDAMSKDHTFSGSRSAYGNKNLTCTVPMTVNVTDFEERSYRIPAGCELAMFRKYSRHATGEIVATVKVSERFMLRVYQGGRVVGVNLDGRDSFRIVQRRTPTLA